ncbi:PD-(D/E)XK nuclease family protein [Halalkalicoccus jeotgali]|uniref:Nuclease subunit B-like protein n=1 Tax=Halalkalicoccus jeotgali (strain DSM 18796 / CECT 7217 / JCM 14584 / KCTC 4019 / B3) TaxID=795797 RepID=D8JBP8_HALJB|nr:PD-(D/E)XK nuclease family protein [Halalkalicoccus jeotgali]ADJ16701.1 nuclease subunit B-like protein [Halalkalicoccus jeotgali B3]ELY40832.1 nuclease subunit B-like protein [Halalkalicoccus jeotgali B3]
MPIPTLLYGPSFDRLRTEAFTRINPQANDPESILFVEANTAQHDAHRTYWHTEHDPLQLTVCELSDVVRRAHDRLIAPIPEVDTLDRQRIIEQAVADSSHFEKPRQYTNFVSELIRALEEAGYQTPDAITTALSTTDLPSERIDVISEIVDRYSTYRDLIAHPAAQPRSQLYESLANTSGSLTTAFPSVETIILSGYTDPAPVEVAVINRLAEEFPLTILLPTTNGNTADPIDTDGADRHLARTHEAYEPLEYTTEYVPSTDQTQLQTAVSRMYTHAASTEPPVETDTVSWHTAPTPDREVRHLARRLREQLADPTRPSPDETRILAPGLLTYRDQISDIFAEYGIEYTTSLSILLEQTYAGRAIQDAIALCIEETSEPLTRLATNPVVSLSDIDTAALVALERRYRPCDLETLKGRSRSKWLTTLTQIQQSVTRAQSNDGTAAIHGIANLVETLKLETNVENLPEDVEGGYERRAISRAKRILQSLLRICEHDELDIDDPLTEIEQAFEGVRVPAPKQHHANRVRIIGLEDTLMADCEALYVLGATEENLPGHQSRPRYFQQIADAAGVLPADRHQELARYRFGAIVSNADSVHITTPKETMDGEQILPSALVEELDRTATVTQTSGLADERRGSCEDVQRALAGSPPDKLEELLNGPSATETFTPAQIESSRAGAECASNRATPGPSVHDGRLPTESLDEVGDRLTKQPYSPSRLNTYAQCGFKYYLRNGFELEEPDEESADTGRFAIGDVVHETLERFYTELAKETTGGVDLTEYDETDLRQRLYAAGKEAVADSDESFSSPFDRQQLAALFTGIVPPEDNRFFLGTDEGDEESTGLLVEFLRREQRDGDWQPRFFEQWFDGEAGPIQTPDGTELPVSGLIDRIDLDTETPAAARVLDYKTYKADTNDVIRGIDFQLLAYTFGAERFLETELGDPHQRVEAGYRIVKPPTTITHKQSLPKTIESNLEIPADQFLQTVAPRRFTEITEAIETGTFSPAIVGEDTAKCQYCAFSDVCDVRHHRRFEAIEAIDNHDLPVYVPDGTRPGDLTEHLEVTADE